VYVWDEVRCIWWGMLGLRRESRTSPFSLTFSSSCGNVNAGSGNEAVVNVLTLYGAYHLASRVLPLRDESS